MDDLHQRAGSGNVITMHGQLRYLRCLDCNTLLESLADKDLTDQFIDCLICQDNQFILRPHVVWFGETPFGLSVIEQAILSCDLFLVIGTSENVYPASSLLLLAKQVAVWSVCVNFEPPKNEVHFDQFHQGLASQILSALVEQWTSYITS